jgi:hypothetical protein
MPTLETPRSFARWAPGKVDRQQRVRIRVTDMTGVDALWRIVQIDTGAGARCYRSTT